MYKQCLEVRDTKVGKGIFTTVKIPANSMIAEISGPIVLEADLPDDSSVYLQVGPNTYIGPSGSLLPEYINHSCNPNCKMHVVGNRAFLYSLYIIPANAELNFDYSTTSTDTTEYWKMDCKCGDNKCRKTISGHHYLNEELKSNYKGRGMLPLYILEPNLIQKR